VKNIEIVNRLLLKKIYKKRPEWSHKGDFGHLLVIGGSKKYSGSPAFNTLAAYRSGVDLVTVVAPKRAANIIATFSSDMITYPLEGDYLKKKHLKEIFGLIGGVNALVIGGGLERNKETLETVRRILGNIKVPCVIDADAIYALIGYEKLIKHEFVITPHANEFFALTGIKPESIEQRRIELVRNSASILGCVMVLKGHVDVISNRGKSAINKTGSPYMTVGGTGDTLAGICGALLARGIDSFDAACAACYINGMAGSFAARKYGEGMMASDLINEIPNVIKLK